MEFVKVNLAPLARFREEVERDLYGTGDGPIRQAFRRWARRYRQFLAERFDTFSKGGGDWPALAASTIARRRKGVQGSVARSKRGGVRSSLMRLKGGGLASAGGTFTILADKLHSFQIALTPTFESLPGQLENHIPFGVEVGFGGTGRYKGRGSRASIADIASFHQKGEGNLPQRKIIVPPDEKTIGLMAGDMDSAVSSVARGA